MSSESKKSAADKDKSKVMSSKEDIYAGFQALRSEQRALANKLSELEMDLNEHKVVIDTLKLVNEDRKCYRMIGGILCERTVKDVMPILQTNKEQLTKVIEALNEQLTKKGVELNEYKEKHNIKIRGQDDDLSQKDKDSGTDNSGSGNQDKTSTRGNVLVANS
ncbi:prefoldin subunit 2 [Chrysoperla carnea]|uniref:prefoldin subunit 2 n=1 Tax=Chrysoperla carnea TaxID=189513 RepID=UPI001D0878BB|nr:prefoldin subunit 2 [Chrysoperla carnea]